LKGASRLGDGLAPLLSRVIKLMLAFKPVAAFVCEAVAPLAAMIGAHDLGKPEGTELEDLAVQLLQFVEERVACGTLARFEVPGLAMRDEPGHWPRYRPSPPSPWRNAKA
jgi:hypothetical protein